MKAAQRFGLLVVAFAAGAVTPVVAADALSALDEYNVRSAIILNCHPSRNAGDSAFLAKGDVLRGAALAALRAQLDKADPAHAPDNAKKATAMLEQQRQTRNFDIQEQVRNYGCDWLDPSRREELGFGQGRTANAPPR